MNKKDKDNDTYEVTLNELYFLRRPMNAILKKIQAVNFITPNLLTFFSFVAALIAVCFLLLPGYQCLISSGVMIILSYLFDCADGRLARLKGMESNFGFWFDRITDQTKLSLLILALGIRSHFLDGEEVRILIFTAIIIIIQILKEFNWSLYEIYRLQNIPQESYEKSVLDNLDIKFTKDSLYKRFVFYVVRILIFLHYEQIFVLSIFPLVFKPKLTIYIYGVLSIISFLGKILIYTKIFIKSDAQRKNHRVNSGSR